MDHLQLRGRVRRQGSLCPTPPCPIAPYLLGSASGPSRAAAPAAARPALRSGPTCSLGPARAPLPGALSPGPSLAAAVSAAAASSSPSSPAPGRASSCPPLGQRQPRFAEGCRALGARRVPGVRSPVRLRRAPLCTRPDTRALSGFSRPGATKLHDRRLERSAALAAAEAARSEPQSAPLRPVAPAAPVSSPAPASCHNAERCRSLSLVSL